MKEKIRIAQPARALRLSPSKLSTVHEADATILRGIPEHPEFSKALNARAIISDLIPDIDLAKQPQELPYCMRYQVASLVSRFGACSPRVAVAEEARDGGSDAIFNHIMSQPALYKRQKQEFTKPEGPDGLFFEICPYLGLDEMIYDIAEKQGISELVPHDDYRPSSLLSTDPMLNLLTSLLPVYLPAKDKDQLILTAAYYGDIDRYTRLWRPKPARAELCCVIRGIYHHPLFALWWSRQPNILEDPRFYRRDRFHIQKAIGARHIMNNNISRLLAHKDDKETHHVPGMREACLCAAIFADYRELFDELLVLPGVVPNYFLLEEAEKSSSQHYVYIESSYRLLSVKDRILLERSSSLATYPSVPRVWGDMWHNGTPYDGVGADADMLVLCLMAPEAWRPHQERFSCIDLNYEEWPLKW
ncbi:uncharacterized protein F5Z01DRAFT_692989 [Emericellopsis atlantica]|uniref:Uncharacterized protein n=1 Tax=Emericellopsis atlantica TaxID=2614577 RepID=A0A9P7ZTM9_9HYPO|nr:uncharacterized protein F5Z01DRAFT_692989 [Emericellopsis atlantica]KAG9258055.1 hypothetical protein F5Z01DRAFT_692989 [Emericellopsis atlantica]